MSAPRSILIIDGHPYDQSLCAGIAAHLKQSSEVSGDRVDLLSLRELQFDPIMRYGYRKIQELEPDLIRAQALLKSADHIVVITPIWWGGPTALLKGFFDRTFLPGFAFKYRKNSQMWDKLFAGKTGHVIATSDGPVWWMRWVRGDSTIKMIVESTLNFVGIAPVKVTRIGKIKWLSLEQREKIVLKLRA
ncbi:hypothetical protein D3C87_1353210 [compost metagenome]